MKNQTKSDHDMLVVLDTKMDGVIGDIKDLKDGFSSRLANHELRLLAIEKIHDEVKPTEAMAELNKVIAKVHDFSLMWRFVVGGVIVGSSIITWILTTLAEVFNLLK